MEGPNDFDQTLFVGRCEICNLIATICQCSIDQVFYEETASRFAEQTVEAATQELNFDIGPQSDVVQEFTQDDAVEDNATGLDLSDWCNLDITPLWAIALQSQLQRIEHSFNAYRQEDRSAKAESDASIADLGGRLKQMQEVMSRLQGTLNQLQGSEKQTQKSVETIRKELLALIEGFNESKKGSGQGKGRNGTKGKRPSNDA